MSTTVEFVITSFKEPGPVADLVPEILAASAGLLQLGFEFKTLFLVAPDKETIEAGKKAYKLASKRLLKYGFKAIPDFKIIKDPQKGKPFALNLVFKQLSADIVGFTDGDLWLPSGSVVELFETFLDYPDIDAVTGRPVPLNSRDSMLGFWAHLTTTAGAHKHRLKAVKYNKPLNLSGYLWAAKRKFLPKRIPPTIKADDAYISHYIRQKGGKIWYNPAARVYVLFPLNFRDWVKQKVRAIGGDHQINMLFAGKHKHAKTRENKKKTQTPHNMRSFWAEAKGIFEALKYPKNIKEWFYFLALVLARLYVWALIFVEYNILKTPLKTYGWDRVESTKEVNQFMRER